MRDCSALESFLGKGKVGIGRPRWVGRESEGGLGIRRPTHTPYLDLDQAKVLRTFRVLLDGSTISIVDCILRISTLYVQFENARYHYL